jgi:hypothetical protein
MCVVMTLEEAEKKSGYHRFQIQRVATQLDTTDYEFASVVLHAKGFAVSILGERLDYEKGYAERYLGRKMKKENK